MDEKEWMSDEEIISGIQGTSKERDNAFRSLLSSSFRRPIESYLLKNGAEMSDVEEVFHDALMVLYEKVLQEGFELRSRLQTYLFGISKNLWLKKMMKKKSMIIESGIPETIDEKSDEQNLIEKERIEIILKAIDLMDERCKKVLISTYTGKSFEAIAYELGSNTNYARQVKFNCIKKLKDLLSDRIKELK